MPDKIVNHFVLADGSTAKYDAENLANDVLNGNAGATAKFQIDGIKANVDYKNAFDGQYKQGLYSNADGVYNPTRTDYVCTVDPIPLDDVGLIRITDFGNITEFYLLFFDENNNFIVNTTYRGGVVANITLGEDKGVVFSKYTNPGSAFSIPTNAKYFHVDVKNANGLTPTTASKITVLCEHIGISDVDTIKTNFENNGLYYLEWQNAIYYYGSSGSIAGVANRIGLVKPVTAEHDLTASVDNGYKMSITFYTTTTPSLETEAGRSGWITSDYLIPKGSNFLVNLAKTSDGTILPKEGKAFKLEKAEPITNAFVIGSDLLKMPVVTEYLGELFFHQAFCRYGGNYYSINGTNIAIQNENFVTQYNYALNTGHGNSLQLGHNGKAYASGWDDNTVYVVDLETHEVTDTITLPTTGYTTVAIDDINFIAYIFQRSDRPSTEAQYNFIVYDYVNEQTLKTKKTIPFGAMQACDFYNDRIIVLNGLGTEVCPNGYRVYDLDGNMLADYTLPNFSTNEPEGVCIDRDNKDLLISFVDKKVYKVRIYI